MMVKLRVDRNQVVVEINGIWVNVSGIRTEVFWDVGSPKSKAGDQSSAGRAETCNAAFNRV